MLLVTLLMSSVLGVVCAAACAHREHHQTQAKTEPSCHGQLPSSPEAGLTDGTVTFCHEQAATATSTAADLRVVNAAPVVSLLPLAFAFPRPGRPVPAWLTSISPTEIIIHRTPLRI